MSGRLDDLLLSTASHWRQTLDGGGLEFGLILPCG